MTDTKNQMDNWVEFLELKKLLENTVKVFEKFVHSKDPSNKWKPSPIYGLGSPDPIPIETQIDDKQPCQHWYSPSGVDTKVEIDGEPIADCQAISWKYVWDTEGRRVEGTLIFALFLSSTARIHDWMKQLGVKNLHDITVSTADEYGNRTKTLISNVSFTQAGHDVSVDDLITEICINYQAEDIELIECVDCKGKDFLND